MSEATPGKGDMSAPSGADRKDASEGSAAQPFDLDEQRPGWVRDMNTMLDAYMDRDPAARNRLEVALTSTGLHAVMWHKMCNFLWRMRLKLLARMLSNIGRWLFGVEIHPQVEVGRRLFIDHGMGIVFGGTTVIGDDVSVYQGVTLGGITQTDKGKRHPTIRDGVVIGAGAKVLGPIEVGEGARIGSNAVVVKDVAAGATVVGVPGHEVSERGGKGKDRKFSAYGESVGECEDEVEVLSERIKELEKRLDVLEKPKRRGKASGQPQK